MKLNINFENRKGVYPKIEDIESMENIELLETINSIPLPLTIEEGNIFNKLFNELHQRGIR
jgi:hypothetical protein